MDKEKTDIKKVTIRLRRGMFEYDDIFFQMLTSSNVEIIHQSDVEIELCINMPPQSLKDIMPNATVIPFRTAPSNPLRAFFKKSESDRHSPVVGVSGFVLLKGN